MKKAFLLLIIAAIMAGTAKAQHCRYDGSIVLVLDIRSAEDHKPVPGLDIKLAGPDSLEYYRSSWTYTAQTKYPSYVSEYMRFIYITQEMIMEVARETDRKIPLSLLNKYVLWLGPEVYRNALGNRAKEKRYLKDVAKINIEKDGLTRGVECIALAENAFWRGCTTSEIWHNSAKFQTVYFSRKEVEMLEKLR